MIDFVLDIARDLYEVTSLPYVYEKAQYDPVRDETPLETMKKAVPQRFGDDVHVFQMQNTTAVILYDRASNELTIAFDPTSQRDDVQFNRDEVDNFMRGPKAHELGGHVHGGLYSDLQKPFEGSDVFKGNMIDALEGMILDYASQEEQEITVNFTGFSRGAAISGIAAGELMSRDTFSHEGVALGDMYLFGAMPQGDAEYVSAFEAQAEELGASVFSVEVHGDVVPSILTENGPGFFTRYEYDSVGQHVYLTPESDGNVRIDYPQSDEALLELRAQEKPEHKVHSDENYSSVMNRLSSQDDQILQQSDRHVINSSGLSL